MNVRFIRFLQDTYSQVLPGELQIRLSEAGEEDRGRRTKSGAPSKRRDASKAVLFDVLESIDQKDSSTFPIKFEELTFNIFAGFLKTFKKTITKRSQSSDDTTIVETQTLTIRLGAGSFSAA